MPLSKQEEFFVPEFSEEEVSIATTERSSFSARNMNQRVANLGEVEEVEDAASGVKKASNSSAHSASGRGKKDADDDDVFAKPVEPPRRITRSAQRSLKAKKEAEERKAAEAATGGGGDDISASDSVSEFEDLGQEEVPPAGDEGGNQG